MNGKERMRLAMRGKKPDRVPVMCQLATGHIYRNAGIAPLDYWYTPAGYVEGNVRMVERYRFDGVLSDACELSDPRMLLDLRSIDTSPEGYLAVFLDGGKVLFPADDDPRPVDAPRPVDTADIDSLDIDSIKVWESEEDIPGHYSEVLDRILLHRGETLSVHGEVETAFGMFLSFSGCARNGLVALLDNPEKSMEIMQRLNRSVIVSALAQCGKGIDALKLSSPFAGSGFISKRMYARFVLPLEREVVEAVKRQYDIPCYVHTCGKIGDRLELLTETGVDGIECLDPAPLGDVDLANAAERIGDKVFIKGNLDSVNELTGRTPDEIVRLVRQRLETGMKINKGFILSTACSVSPRTPP